MGNTTMEEFMKVTRQSFKIYECMIGKYDCTHDWSVVGTIYGVCLFYKPEGKFPRDTELRLTMKSNTTGTLLFKNILAFQIV